MEFDLLKSNKSNSLPQNNTAQDRQKFAKVLAKFFAKYFAFVAVKMILNNFNNIKSEIFFSVLSAKSASLQHVL
ncbi:MAG: hypothetical protein QM541_11310 [Flavobacterium sp.]|nr:hypothetical protein [Flavobacterium sp.]